MVAVAKTNCKCSLAVPVDRGPHLQPTGRHPRLGLWSTLWVWPGVFLVGASTTISLHETKVFCTLCLETFFV